MNANQINDAMDALGARVDAIPTTGGEGSAVNASISDWQDFYWSEYEQWPVNDIARWETTLRGLTETVDALADKYEGQDAPIAEASKPAKTVANIGVYATWPLWMKVTAGGLIGLMLYKAARETKLL